VGGLPHQVEEIVAEYHKATDDEVKEADKN
jgi:hypothetical protein